MAPKTSVTPKTGSGSPTSVQVLGEWAGAFREPAINSDKVWAACYLSDGTYMAVYGRRGTKYNPVVKKLGNVASARREFETKVAEKRGKGYRAVAFRDPQNGNIPAFSSMGGVSATVSAASAPRSGQVPQPVAASQPATITVDTLMAQMKSLAKRLQAAMGGTGDITSLAFEHYQISLMADAFADGDEGAVLTAQMDTLRVQFQTATTSTRAFALEL